MMAALPQVEAAGIGATVTLRALPAEILLRSAAARISIPQMLIWDPARIDPATRTAEQSILGRDVLRHYALYMDEAAGTVLLFEREEIVNLRYNDAPLQ